MDINPIIHYHPNSSKRREQWYLNNHFYRADGPAYIQYYKSGKKQREVWYLNDDYHRVDGPADISYYKSGKIKKEEWYLNGKESNHKEWLIANNLYKPYNTWTDEEKVLWKLTWT